MTFKEYDFQYLRFSYSKQLRSARYTTGGLSSDIPVRRNIKFEQEDYGAVRAQHDWSDNVCRMKGFCGSMAPAYGLMQVAVPECLPDRLEAIAYASEIGFLYDDLTEFMDAQQVAASNTGMERGLETPSNSKSSSGISAIQAKLYDRMSQIDAERARFALDMWMKFLRDSAGRQHNVKFQTYEEYMAYRVLDVGELFWLGLVAFGMALTIPHEDLALMRQLSRSCWVVLALQNDICSYEKEVRAAGKDDNIVNVLTILMRQHNIDMKAAKDMAMSLLNEELLKYKVVLQDLPSQPLSFDTKIYLEALLFTISGDAAWSLDTPRYNAEKRYTVRQLRLLHDTNSSISQLPQRKNSPKRRASSKDIQGFANKKRLVSRVSSKC